MYDLAKRISATVVSRYRPHLIAFAAFLVLFHVGVLVSGIRAPEDQIVAHLMVYSQGLLGFTGALLLLFLLSQTVHALQLEEENTKEEIHTFIKDHLKRWFSSAESSVDSVDDVVDDVTFTDFKVQGDPAALGGGPVAEDYAEDVHFELTFYPTKLIYGLHFESGRDEVNRTFAESLRDQLGLGPASGFEVDHVVPKKPAWVFLIRTVPLTGKFEEDFAEIMTHARHFVELVGHTYDLVYSPSSLEQYGNLLDKREPAGGGALPA